MSPFDNPMVYATTFPPTVFPTIFGKQKIAFSPHAPWILLEQTARMTTNGLNHPAPRPFRVAIIGAGIAGLSAALSLRHFLPSHPNVVEVTIYEKATQLREIGASIALNPSGLRILDKLGVEEALSPEIAYRQPSGHPMVYLHWLTSEIIAWDEYRGFVDQERHSTARYHRAYLQRALLRALEGIPDVDLRLGVRAKSFDILGDGVNGGPGVAINFEDGSTAEVDLLIGADGIHSKVRQDFAPEHRLRWTGQVALRATFDAGLIREIPDVPEDAVHIVGHETTMFASYLGMLLSSMYGCRSWTDRRRLQATRTSTPSWEITFATHKTKARHITTPNGTEQVMWSF